MPLPALIGSKPPRSEPPSASEASRATEAFAWLCAERARFVPALDAWCAGRWSDVQAALAAPDVFSSRPMRPADHTLLGADPPVHTARRAIVAKAFQAAVSDQQLLVRLDERIAMLLDGWTKRRRIDAVADLALPLMLSLTGLLLGLPDETRGVLAAWSRATVELGEGRGALHRDTLETCDRRVRELVAARWRSPRSDFPGHLVRTTAVQLTHEQIVSVTRLLVPAGIETTASLIGHAIVRGLRHTRWFTDDLVEPRLDRLIEETLRLDSPVQFVRRAFMGGAAELRGQIPVGSAVVLVLAAAGRDGSRTAGSDDSIAVEPDEFDVSRRPRRHLAFGHGPHYCLGAELARVAARRALEALASVLRARGGRLAPSGVSYHSRGQLWRPKTVVIELG